MEDEKSETALSTRQTLNRGPSVQNGLPEKGDTRLEVADDGATNSCEPEQVQDYLANE